MKKKGNKENIAYFYYTLELYYIELDVFVCMHKLNFYHRPMPIIIFMEVLLDDESLSLINLYNFHSPQVTSNAYTVSRIMSMCRTKRFIFKYVLIITFTSNKKKKNMMWVLKPLLSRKMQILIIKNQWFVCTLTAMILSMIGWFTITRWLTRISMLLIPVNEKCDQRKLI